MGAARTSNAGVAVVGLSCHLPGAPDAETWLSATAPALAPVPAGRTPRPLPIDPTPGALDAVTTDVGGWLTARAELPTPTDGWPVADLDPVYGDVLSVVARALPATVARDRTGLVLANLSLPTSGHVRRVGAALLDTPPPWLDGGLAPDRYHSHGPARCAAEVLGLGGGWEALDAACASGLYALHVAVQRLRAGEVDCAVAAAVNRADASYLLLGFSQLRALSASGVPRPFDRRADGLVVGEGAVAVVLKRLDDAVRDGDRIHAVLVGGAAANDGRKGNLLAPDAAGQLRTMRAAWSRSGRSAADLSYVECHATGTRKGDGTELTALDTLLADAGADAPVAVASAKALVGHTVTAAGLAGLLRAIGAVRDGVLHPAVSCDEPRDELADSPRLHTVAERTPWPDGRPRVAAVSAFGFGGTDAHWIVEAFDADAPPAPAPPLHTGRLAVVGAAARCGAARGVELLEALAEGRRLLTPAPASVTRGVGPSAEGAWIPALRVDPRRWRIPPVELADLLPQQLLALELAADALSPLDLDPGRVATVLGMETDPQVAEPVVRQAIHDDDPTLADAVHPALTAQKVQGSLPNFVANRLAAQLDLQGPSYVVSAGARSTAVALQHAARWLADDDADAVVVGAVDLSGHPAGIAAHRALHGDLPQAEGGVVLVVKRAEDAARDGDAVLFELDPTDLPGATDHRPRIGHGGAADDGLALIHALATGTVAQAAPWPEPPTGFDPVLVVPHGGPSLAAPERAFAGDWGGDTLPRPLPVRDEAARLGLRLDGPLAPPEAGLSWPWPEAPARPAAAAAAPRLAPALGARTAQTRLDELRALATDMARSARATAEAHDAFLRQRDAALDQLEQVGDALAAAVEALSTGRAAPGVSRPPAPAPAPPSAPTEVPRAFDRVALERHAAGALSEVFGPTYADLDPYEPRVRMPMAPLLLVSRARIVEGERGELGPARIVTEYDLPVDAEWSADGRPPPCVLVESGQADLFLVSFLGIDEHCRGERVYRLLDCDLTFQGPRPLPGTTLRHDIRIDRFARLGDTILFYFQYDCVRLDDAGQPAEPVLTMRNGCAGFFTPAELATPRGVDASPRPDHTAAPVPALGDPLPEVWDDAAVLEMTERATPTLPRSRWRLVHRVQHVTTTGGPHGLGEVRYVQDLRDDDWFNPCHFKGDPCMPGTLMFDGCLQAVQVWLLALGVGTRFTDATFEPLPGCSAKLRCRGQVVPGHSKLEYRAFVTSAGLEPTPWAIADVVLLVDGTPVVRAEDVGVRVEGEPSAPLQPEGIGTDRILEFSVGSAVRAFGPWYSDFDGPAERCARMPGPPLLQMSRVLSVDGPPREIAAPRTVRIAYDVPPDAWFWRASPGSSMPWAILLETALQPCGWLTAWQAAGIAAPDLHFRNLGGTAVQHVEVWPWTGELVTTATQTSVSASGGLQVQFFDIEVHAGDVHVLTVHTHFGYFTAKALDGQKGLPDAPLPPEGPCVDVDLAAHPALPRDDWRMLDRVTVADPEGGPEGLGAYAADKLVDPAEWFFTAHFWLDPVMPGSLGLEALLQLARFVWHERLGPVAGRIQPLPLAHEVSWTYRGQVRLPNERMQADLVVRELSSDRIVCDGVIRADGLPIYVFEGFGLHRVDDDDAPPPPALVARPAPAAALLDTFTVDGDTGHGGLRLDPTAHPWLADHCPTVAVPAVPLAFVAEIAAEAALQLRPDARVVGLPQLVAERWLHTGDGPVDLQVVAVAEGDLVAVTLAVHEHNERFPALSGPRVHMRAVVQLGDTWAAAPELVETGGTPDTLDPRAEYDGGGTFHGPVLQAMTALQVGPTGAVATLQPADDAELLGTAGPAFVLDPLLLDAATHPMLSGQPERWVPGLAAGHLAYPTGAEGLRLHGPRPTGPVRAALSLVEGTDERLVFDVVLSSDAGPWCSYRWTEAIVPAGPALGHPAPVRRAFLWEHEAVPEVTVGRATERGWQVSRTDIVEPLPGTVLRQWSADEEVAVWRRSADPAAEARERLAAKELLRRHLTARLGRDVHPRHLVLRRLRPGRWVVGEAPTLSAQHYVDHLHPTRFHVHTTDDGGVAEAWITPGDGSGEPPFDRGSHDAS